MPDYIRSWRPGGTFFFTVNLLERRGDGLLVRHIEALRDAVRVTRAERPFEIVAWVVLPDHMHAIWSLPESDSDYTTRWAAIKARFSKSIPMTEYRDTSRIARGERGIWQRRRADTRSVIRHSLHPYQGNHRRAMPPPVTGA